MNHRKIEYLLMAGALMCLVYMATRAIYAAAHPHKPDPPRIISVKPAVFSTILRPSDIPEEWRDRSWTTESNHWVMDVPGNETNSWILHSPGHWVQYRTPVPSWYVWASSGVLAAMGFAIGWLLARQSLYARRVDHLYDRIRMLENSLRQEQQRTNHLTT